MIVGPAFLIPLYHPYKERIRTCPQWGTSSDFVVLVNDTGLEPVISRNCWRSSQAPRWNPYALFYFLHFFCGEECFRPLWLMLFFISLDIYAGACAKTRSRTWLERQRPKSVRQAEMRHFALQQSDWTGRRTRLRYYPENELQKEVWRSFQLYMVISGSAPKSKMRIDSWLHCGRWLSRSGTSSWTSSPVKILTGPSTRSW